MKNKIPPQKGFTLVELLVVISVIGLLASVVLVSFPASTKKGRDSKRVQELKQIQTALRLYYDLYHEMPINRDGTNFYCDGHADFLKELVDKGLWPHKPEDPAPKDPWWHYCYYNYGENDSYGAGALLVAGLESYKGKEGVSGSCRPFSDINVRCNNQDSNSPDYCLCTPYAPYW